MAPPAPAPPASGRAGKLPGAMAGGAARDDLNASVLALVGEVLGRDGRPPGSTERLADLGFDSIAYAELAAALYERTGVDLVDAGLGPLRTVGTCSTRWSGPRAVR